MKNKFFIDIDTDRKERPIIIAKDQGPAQSLAEAQASWNEDVACLCEALCTLIHVGENMKWKPSAQTLRECMKHLQDGFADASYQTETPMGSVPYPERKQND